MQYPQVLYCHPERAGQLFRPSNGTEGDIWECAFCSCCIHEKYIHTGDTNDKSCDIMMNMMAWDTSDKNYPKEVVFSEAGWPICKAWVKWDWDKDDEGGWNDPPPVAPEDPNQLCLPFVLEEMEFNTVKPLTPQYHE